MLILDGKVVSQIRREKLKQEILVFQQKYGRAPQLVVVVVGEHPASALYVKNKIKSCADVGIRSAEVRLPAGCTEKELRHQLEKMNQDRSVDGILVQLPLPQGLDAKKLSEWISPHKDVDGFSYENMGRFWANQTAIAPCTPQGIMNLLNHYKIEVSGKNAVVIGRSHIVGLPMSHLLTQADATVTLCHSKTKNLRQYTQQADIVVVAAGKKEFLGQEDFKKDSVVIDVGIHGSGSGGKIAGDVRFHELEGWVEWATPVPGGVGPMTITTLLENTLKLAQLNAGGLK